MNPIRTLTFDEASDLCEAIGTPAPYPGYARDLKNGTAVRCVKDRTTGKCHFELCEFLPE